MNESKHLLALAIATASRVHLDQMGKDGQPYILHPLRLLMRATTDKAKTVAVLHDAIEDTPLTLAELAALGYPEEILTALDGLTKKPNEGYEAFIERLAPNPLARTVKLLDLYDNIDVTRLPDLGEGELKRTAKYHRAIKYLESLP